jgi:1-acyl-sn-glycerol-3-phosphate acyltransferase
MKTFKEIFGRIWAFWGLVSFVLTFLIIFIPSMLCYLIPGNKGQYAFIKIAKLWVSFWLRLIGCPVTVVSGKENFAPGTAYVITFNHNALLDVPLSAPFIPGANKTIAKISFTKVPIFGWYYRKGSVLVDRDSDKSRRKSFDDMKKVLQDGMHMSIFPEGTRNRTKEPLKQFYAGAFKLAADTKTPVIPAIILHTKKAMPIHKAFYLMPHRLEVHFLPPVPSTDISAGVLKEKVFKIMSEFYLANE